MPRASDRLHTALPDRIRAILAGRGLSLADVSRSSRSLLSGNRLQHIPHNFYSALHNRSFSPSIYQLHTLSVLSGYRLVDWLAVFDFSFDDVRRFQAALPALRTVELDTRIYQTRVPVPWLRDLQEPDLDASLVPLSRWLVGTTTHGFGDPIAATPAYRYLKIGLEDAFAYPELLPGSIVRVTRLPDAVHGLPVGGISRGLFLVEHGRGFVCSRVLRPETSTAVLCSRHLPYAPVELRQGAEALISGIVDMEFRRLENTAKPVVPAGLGQFWIPEPLPLTSKELNFGELLRRARIVSGFSFRQASARTRIIARKLKDDRYYCAASSLSDYETRSVLPRHIHKLISISAAYFARTESFLRCSGVDLETAGQLPLPAEFLDLPDEGGSVAPGSQFLSGVRRRFGDIPLFLHDSLPILSGLPDLSIRDVFWAGGAGLSLHPHLTRILLLVVDRKQKIPHPSFSRPKWAQPVFILQQRDDSYLCGFCSLQNGVLMLRSCSGDKPKLLRLRNRIDAEVVGRVVGVVRQTEGRSQRPGLRRL